MVANYSIRSSYGVLFLLGFILPCLTDNDKKNVLLFISDDFRSQLGAYEGPDFPGGTLQKMYTPNLDALTTQSLFLKRAYIQISPCSPSRSSMLTSRRPLNTQVYTNGPNFRKVGGYFTTLPQYFKTHGYITVGLGKVFHSSSSPGKRDNDTWSEPFFRGTKTFEGNKKSWNAIPDNLAKKRRLIDQQIAERTVKTLRTLAPQAVDGTQPFFIATGFYKPHLPFVFPESFLRHYRDVKLPSNPYAPQDMPQIGLTRYQELNSYADIRNLRVSSAINATFPDEVAIDLRRAYYASVSYIDSLVGQVLAELLDLGLYNNTVVAFCGDHGWQLGEHGRWGKHNLFEESVQSPLIIRVPKITDSGVSSRQITEFVDLFPTLVEAAGLPRLPECPEFSRNVSTCTDGKSLLPLIRNPNIPIRAAAFSQFRLNSDVMGYSMRTDIYRYTEWVEFRGTPKWNGLHGAELYDHEVDPREKINQANVPEYAAIREQLSQQLRTGYTKGL